MTTWESPTLWDQTGRRPQPSCQPGAGQLAAPPWVARHASRSPRASDRPGDRTGGPAPPRPPRQQPTSARSARRTLRRASDRRRAEPVPQDHRSRSRHRAARGLRDRPSPTRSNPQVHGNRPGPSSGQASPHEMKPSSRQVPGQHVTVTLFSRFALADEQPSPVVPLTFPTRHSRGCPTPPRMTQSSGRKAGRGALVRREEHVGRCGERPSIAT
jgi:hypothetical protein